MAFVNAFVQQFVVFAVFCVVAIGGMAIGITMQKKKNASESN